MRLEENDKIRWITLNQYSLEKDQYVSRRTITTS